MNIPPLRLPTGYTSMGAPAPSLKVDSKGQCFYGVQSKYNTTAYAFRVFLQPSVGEARLLATLDMPGGTVESGQGRLEETGGLLIAVAYDRPGDGKRTTQSVVITEYVGKSATPHPPIILAPAAAVWQFTVGAYTAGQVDTPAKIAALLTLHKNALAEIRNALVISGVIVKG